MQIGEKIKNYRKTAGLTQEQVADYLDVSTPAVNKWEKGNTYPDISLLPAIARLLKIDMNELFSFREELTEKEIGQFVNELSEVSLDSFIKAFEMGKNKIKEYPHCDSLIYSIATVLNAALTLSDVDDEKKLECNNVIVEWLERTAESPNEKVRISSIFMLAANYIQMEKYKEANIFLDKIPDTVIDGTIMKTNVLAHQEGTDIAAFFLEGKLMQTVTNIQNYLYKLIEMEEETGNHCKAEEIAEITEHMVSLFGLWDYGKVVPYLLIAVYRKDVEKCIQLIKEVLMESQKPWKMVESPLYYRYADTVQGKSFSGVGNNFVRALAAEIENKEEYEFLKGNKELEAIFTRTYGEKRKMPPEMNAARRVSYDPAKKVEIKFREPVEEYLLVDGYNIIFAWEELNELARTTIDGARHKLMDILCNYQGYKKCTLILVFDAYKVTGNIGQAIEYHNIHVVYTKEAETADQYIEKLAHKMGRNHRVTVATSDGLEQLIIRGQGCHLMSARDLKEEVDYVNQQIRTEYLEKSTRTTGNKVLDQADPELAEHLEKIRQNEPEQI